MPREISSGLLGNPLEQLQRLMIAAIGGVITPLISQSQMSSRWGPFCRWLAWCFLGVLWGPILQAGQRNACGAAPAALFEEVVE